MAISMNAHTKVNKLDSAFKHNTTSASTCGTVSQDIWDFYRDCRMLVEHNLTEDAILLHNHKVNRLPQSESHTYTTSTQQLEQDYSTSEGHPW